jgi:hypothetical protein
LEVQFTTMGKDNIKAPDFKVPVPLIQEEEKEADELDGKPTSVKLVLDAEGEAIGYTMVQVQAIFNGGIMEQFFKW